MKNFFRRVVVALATGFILVYYGELVFWATPDREGMDGGGIIGVWLAYSAMAYPFLCVVSLFRVREGWAVFLAGAFYGWYEEGIVMQTMYGQPDQPFPASLSFTGLAWHALIDVWIGWYWMRRLLAQNCRGKTAAVAAGIGLFYGVWAIFWWNEPPPPMKEWLDAGRSDIVLVRFSIFALASTMFLALAHWLYNRARPCEFKPTKMELWLLGGATLLYFVLVTVPAAPKALWVLPPLMGITLAALYVNSTHEARPDAIVAFAEPVQPLNYLLLLLIPLTAIAVYFVALACHARLPTNLLVYYVTTPLGALLWIASVVMVLRRARGARLPVNIL